MESQEVAQKVREYLPVTSFAPTRCQEILRRITLGRYNPEVYNLVRHYASQESRAEELKKENPEKLIGIGRESTLPRESGLVLGCLFDDREVNVGKRDEFGEGFIDGQVYSIKGETAHKGFFSKSSLMGFALMFASLKYSKIAGPIDEHVYQLIDWLHKGTIGSLVYGAIPMVAHNLFSNDANISKGLITKGFFGIHRNPFYAGLLSAAGLINVQNITTNLATGNPNYLSIGGFLLGTLLFASGIDGARRNDEKGLEKKFGEQYREYMKTTPAYIPKLSNLFRKRKS